MKTVDISGFGGGYEATCQKMLLNGIRFLKDKPGFDWSGYSGYEGIYGVCKAENTDAKALDEAIMEGIGDATGAMHEAVVSHLAYINKHGYDAWIAEGEKREQGVYEVDEEQLENEILISRIEWQLKLDGGYNPIAELFKTIPPENIIVVDPKNPDSIKAAANKIAKIIGELGGSS